jgi:two-component system OmpR family sensor kinase
VSLPDLVRSRLALRFYLVGLAQIVVVAAGFGAILATYPPPTLGPFEGSLLLMTDYLSAVSGDREAVHVVLQKLQERTGIAATVTGPAGERIASTAAPGEDCAVPEEGGATTRGLGPAGRCLARPLRFADGRTGAVTFLVGGMPPPPAINGRLIPLVLLVVGVFSLLLTRSLTRPLRRMSAAARAFGQGDLSARSGLLRRDELGDVSRAFDEMAERVTALLHAEKELLANVSHELRTPLTRIRIALDIAAEGDADVARESLADIAGDLDELETLISDILTAARLDLGDGESVASAMPLRRRRVDVSELLEQASSRFRAAHPGRSLRAAVPENLPLIEGDPALLRRVIDNLLENAHKYTERAGAEVTLTVGVGRLEIEIEVADRGIGIASSDLPKIFRPFFRADRSRTRATGGLGLGLALAKRIVDAHGGSIAATSALGEGTRVVVRLPLANNR